MFSGTGRSSLHGSASVALGKEESFTRSCKAIPRYTASRKLASSVVDNSLVGQGSRTTIQSSEFAKLTSTDPGSKQRNFCDQHHIWLSLVGNHSRRMGRVCCRDRRLVTVHEPCGSQAEGSRGIYWPRGCRLPILAYTLYIKPCR